MGLSSGSGVTDDVQLKSDNEERQQVGPNWIGSGNATDFHSNANQKHFAP